MKKCKELSVSVSFESGKDDRGFFLTLKSIPNPFAYFRSVKRTLLDNGTLIINRSDLFQDYPTFLEVR
jgi:hypothetical protein